jgi:hypothetical protein
VRENGSGAAAGPGNGHDGFSQSTHAVIPFVSATVSPSLRRSAS